MCPGEREDARDPGDAGDARGGHRVRGGRGGRLHDAEAQGGDGLSSKRIEYAISYLRGAGRIERDGSAGVYAVYRAVGV